jgi:hypothetical protein
MRTLALVLVFSAVPARADSFLDAAGGLALPMGEKKWTDTVRNSPKLAVRAGVVNGELGGMLAVDWTPESVNNNPAAPYLDLSYHRFRILAELVFRHYVAPKIALAGRAGAGVDIAHASYNLAIGPIMSSGSDSNVGLAGEFGAGVWFDISPSMQLGGEIALPIGYHSHKMTGNGDFTFDYTSYDIDLLFGVRLWSR